MRIHLCLQRQHLSLDLLLFHDQEGFRGSFFGLNEGVQGIPETVDLQNVGIIQMDQLKFASGILARKELMHLRKGISDTSAEKTGYKIADGKKADGQQGDPHQTL